MGESVINISSWYKKFQNVIQYIAFKNINKKILLSYAKKLCAL